MDLTKPFRAARARNEVLLRLRFSSQTFASSNLSTVIVFWFKTGSIRRLPSSNNEQMLALHAVDDGSGIRPRPSTTGA